MTTTTSSTSIVTALGGGSGIDMKALANNLADASFAARTSRLEEQTAQVDRQISQASSLKSKILGLASAIGTRVRTGDLAQAPLIANAAVAAVTAGTGTASGSYSLEVTRLASAQAITSPPFAAATTPVGSGSLTIRFGTVTGAAFAEDPAHAALDVTIPAGATLADVAGAINAAGAGITAYVANAADGARLVLKGKDGAVNGFTVSATETPGDEGLAALAWDPATAPADRTLASAGDAAFKFDGIAMTAASNAVANVAPGLSLKLTGTNAGSPTTISFSDPTSAIGTVMQDLADALNEIVSELSQDTNPLNGDLSRDSGARAFRQALSQLGSMVVMPNAPTGAPRTLSDLGLAIQRDGTFLVDSTRLTATLKASPAESAAMFTTGLFGVYATMDKLSRKVTSAADPGSLTGSVSRYSKLKTKLASDKADLTEKQEALRAQLVSRFAATDSRVGASRSTLSFLQNQIAAWNAQNNN